MPAGGLPQQKRKSGVFEDPIEGVTPHDMRHLSAKSAQCGSPNLLSARPPGSGTAACLTVPHPIT